MAATVLSEEVHRRIEHDADEKVEMLTPAQLEMIASKLNGWVNLPILSEEKEQVIFVKIVKQVDRYIYKSLPNEIYELIAESTDGITTEEAEMIEDRMAAVINRQVTIPYLTERMEQKVFEFVLGIILSALVKGKSL